MASTYSSSLRFELIGNGEQAGTWGTTTNTNLGTLVEGAIAGYNTVSVTSASQALTASNGAVDQARLAMLRLTTTTTADFAVYVPPTSKLYVIRNDTSYIATVYNSTVLGNTTAAGAGVAIPAGKIMTIWTDGTNVRVQNSHVIGTVVGNVTGDVTGNVTGNASTATALQTARTINGTSFNGSANITTTAWGTSRTLSYTGDVTGSSAVDGSADAATALTIANNAVTTAKILNANVTPAKLSQPFTAGTAQTAPASPTPLPYIDFTGIPSWVKRVTVMLNGVSTNGTSNLMIQLGTSGGVDSTNYSYGVSEGSGSASSTTAAGFIITYANAAANTAYGVVTIVNVSGNVWVEQGLLSFPNGSVQTEVSAGGKTLSGVLERIRVTTVGGTNTFDAGIVNIMYE